MIKRASPLKKAKQRAWAAFSLYIRTRYMDDSGMVRCVTCDRRLHYTEAQAGHFISGRGNAILFDERGVHPQCRGCNIFGRGRWEEYYSYMKRMYGQETIDELIELKKETVKYKVSDYEELERTFKEKTGSLT